MSHRSPVDHPAHEPAAGGDGAGAVGQVGAGLRSAGGSGGAPVAGRRGGDLAGDGTVPRAGALLAGDHEKDGPFRDRPGEPGCKRITIWRGSGIVGADRGMVKRP